MKHIRKRGKYRARKRGPLRAGERWHACVCVCVCESVCAGGHSGINEALSLLTANAGGAADVAVEKVFSISYEN